MKILWSRNVKDAMTWKGSQPTKAYIIDRKPLAEGGRGIVSVFDISPPFYAFHNVNAWDEGKDVVFEVITYDDAGVVTDLGTETMKKGLPSDSGNFLKRFRLKDVEDENPSAKRQVEIDIIISTLEQVKNTSLFREDRSRSMECTILISLFAIACSNREC